ncbi:MAG TPA: adenylosuccinate synthase [Synergistaceae bacterium]|jgi:adenylosuccinate synthase|nr:adenylosuccinate synthase [Synergistaceae bacterium]MCZ2317253.1 adenylosuccinate synthase [Bacteroidales bacterium]NLL40695.1 adenylosuccinate synthase [Synergistaceae bacterium]HPX03772.1 adenylosuccinate synthase [Synergistaceae bacterium]HQA54712.1 adenylosuccinate synthase [Synergistaceae bacterium]
MVTGSETKMVIGMQWGNEGKGRIVDFIANRSDVVVRFQGASNGGRTILACGERYRIFYLPSGIHHDGKNCLICGGVTLDLEKVSNEIAMLKEAGVLKARLTISKSCHLILDYHKKLDVLDGRIFGHDRNMTMTEQGFGHCCSDKYRRMGIRTADLLYPDILHDKIKEILAVKNEYLTKIYGERPIDPDELYNNCLRLGERLLPYIGEPEEIIANSVSKNLSILFEACDGVLNDVDRGSYPHVMPLSSLPAAALTGTGLRWNYPMRKIGVVKAYSTRNDRGPFVTEESNAVAVFIRNRGKEFSGVSREPRRVGWLDLPAIKYAIKESGVHSLALTKLDVLTGIDEIKVCSAYDVGGEVKDVPDIAGRDMCDARPVYRTFEGWKEDLSVCRDLKNLPVQVKEYIEFIEEETGIPVIWIGLGADWGKALFIRR